MENSTVQTERTQELRGMIEHASHITFEFDDSPQQYTDLRSNYPACVYCNPDAHSLVIAAEMQQAFAVQQDRFEHELSMLAPGTIAHEHSLCEFRFSNMS